MRPDIKGLLFDKDGTLFDFQATWGAWASQFFRDLTKDVAEATTLAASLGYDLNTQKFEKNSVIIAGTPAEIAAGISARLPSQTTSQIIEIANQSVAKAPQIEVVPLLPYLSELKATGMMLGVSTNDAETPARAHLSSAGIIDVFDFIAGYDSGFGAKPGIGMQIAFCDQMGLNPAQVAMVGDSLHDLKAGAAAGMTTIAVLTGLAEHHELEHYADVVLSDIGAIPAWLKNSGT